MKKLLSISLILTASLQAMEYEPTKIEVKEPITGKQQPPALYSLAFKRSIKALEQLNAEQTKALIFHISQKNNPSLEKNLK